MTLSARTARTERLRSALVSLVRSVRPTTTRGVTLSDYREVLGEVFRSGSVAPADGSDPIFLCASGWRTGSTLLQRLVVSDPDIVVWGEPYGDLPVLQQHSEFLKRLAMKSLDDLPLVHPSDIRSSEWIANAYPSLGAVGRAISSFIQEFYVSDVRGAGQRRWGVKSVRWDAYDIELLRAAFPGARFVLLVRDPVDAYRSYSAHYPRVWFDRYPDRRVDNVRTFARHWTRLAGDFAAQRRSPDVLLVRYEDLRESIDAIADHLEIAPDIAVLDRRVRGSRLRPRELNRLETAHLLRRTARVRRTYSY